MVLIDLLAEIFEFFNLLRGGFRLGPFLVSLFLFRDGGRLDLGCWG